MKLCSHKWLIFLPFKKKTRTIKMIISSSFLINNIKSPIYIYSSYEGLGESHVLDIASTLCFYIPLGRYGISPLSSSLHMYCARLILSSTQHLVKGSFHEKEKEHLYIRSKSNYLKVEENTLLDQAILRPCKGHGNYPLEKET